MTKKNCKELPSKIKGILSTLNDVQWDDIEVAISCAPPDDEGEKADAIGFKVHSENEEEDEEDDE